MLIHHGKGLAGENRDTRPRPPEAPQTEAEKSAEVHTGVDGGVRGVPRSAVVDDIRRLARVRVAVEMMLGCEGVQGADVGQLHPRNLARRLGPQLGGKGHEGAVRRRFGVTACLLSGDGARWITRGVVPFRPVAPEQAWRASSMTTLEGGASWSVSRFQATAAPVMPLPTMTTSADGGSAAVLRRSAMPAAGSCQKARVGLARGSVTGTLALSSIAGRDSWCRCRPQEAHESGLVQDPLGVVRCGS